MLRKLLSLFNLVICDRCGKITKKVDSGIIWAIAGSVCPFCEDCLYDWLIEEQRQEDMRLAVMSSDETRWWTQPTADAVWCSDHQQWGCVTGECSQCFEEALLKED